jgi:hypothetical protein
LACVMHGAISHPGRSSLTRGKSQALPPGGLACSDLHSGVAVFVLLFVTIALKCMHISAFVGTPRDGDLKVVNSY